MNSTIICDESGFAVGCIPSTRETLPDEWADRPCRTTDIQTAIDQASGWSALWPLVKYVEALEDLDGCGEVAGLRKAARFLRDRARHFQLPPPEGFKCTSPEKERQKGCDFVLELARSLEGSGISSLELGTANHVDSEAVEESLR